MPIVDIVLAHRGTNQTSQTTAVGDTISVNTVRQRNTTAPLPIKTLTSFAGDTTGRNWNNYMLIGLTGPCQGLYSGIPMVMDDGAGNLSVSYQYQHSGNTSELALADASTRNVFEGHRGDTLTSPYITAVPTPRANPTSPTLWTAIDLGGWLFHITMAGRTITNCGKAFPDNGTWPRLNGSTKVTHGTFVNGYFNGPNDLCFDPNISTIIYVADTFNDRIAKVHETSPGVVSITTYYSGGLNDPYSLYAEADGTLIVADRGNNRIIRIPQVGGPGGTAGTPVNIVTGLAQPMVVRPFSDGNFLTIEFGGTRRILEITRATGATRHIAFLRTPNGDQGTAWFWADVDDNGVLGPVDDFFTVMTSTFDTLRRTSRDGTFGGDANPLEGFVANGSTLTQGALGQVSDPEGHYPWAVACSDTDPILLVTGSGSQQARVIRRIATGDVTTPLTSSQKTIRNRGANIWGGINFDTTEPSYTLTAGFAGGHNFLGAPNKTTEDLDAMGWAEFSTWLRSGGNGRNPRTLTDADVQAVKYYIKMNAVRGLSDSSVDAIGFEPAPPPDPDVFRDVVVGLHVEIDIIPEEETPTPEPEIPDPPDLAIGVSVEVNAGTALNVRSQMLFDPAQDATNIIGTQPVGALGIITGGTGQIEEGFPRWFVDFETGVDGWVAGTRLDSFVPEQEPPPVEVGEPGTWLKQPVANRTVSQAYFSGDQNIVEGQPGAALTVAPNNVTKDGVIFRSFSGGVSGNGRYWYIGGGHAGHPGNDFDIFDANTRVWQPQAFAAECPPPYNPDGTPNSIWRGIAGGAVGTGGFSPTGRPWCMHTYRHMAVDTIRDRLLLTTGNGLGAYTDDGTWTQLATGNKNLNEPLIGSTGAVYFDEVDDAVLILVSDNKTGGSRGVYKYFFNSAGAVTSKTFSHAWPTTTGTDSVGTPWGSWTWGGMIPVPVKGPGRLVYIFFSPTSTSIASPRNRLMTYHLDTHALTWDQTFLPGTAAYDAIFLNGGTGRAWGRRSFTGQLYWRIAGPPSGFWIKTEATNSWAFLADDPHTTTGLAPWTFNYIDGKDIFIGMQARTLYSGIAGARCSGGITNTWIYQP